jgi:hypothetical protein
MLCRVSFQLALRSVGFVRFVPFIEFHEHVASMVEHELFLAVEGVAADAFVFELSELDAVDELFHRGLFLVVAGGAVERIHKGDEGGAGGQLMCDFEERRE